MPPSSTNTYRTVIQILDLLRLLERTPGRAMPINDVAERMGVHRRTVKRWVDALNLQVDNQDGEPVVLRELREGVAWVVMPSQGPALSASIFQYAAAFAATRHLGVGGGSLLGDSAADAVEQLQQAVPPTLHPMVRRVDTAFHYVPFGPKSYRDHEDILDVVIRGVLRSWTLDIYYTDSRGVRNERRVEPYTVVMYRDGLYLLGRRIDEERQPAIRVYAIDRIAEASADRQAQFTVPASFNPTDHLGDLGVWRSSQRRAQVELAFESSVAWAAKERQWPGQAGWSTREDGREQLSMKIRITPEVVTWILGWGATVEVLAPPKLRADVASRHREAANMYGEA